MQAHLAMCEPDASILMIPGILSLTGTIMLNEAVERV